MKSAYKKSPFKFHQSEYFDQVATGDMSLNKAITFFCKDYDLDLRECYQEIKDDYDREKVND